MVAWINRSISIILISWLKTLSNKVFFKKIFNNLFSVYRIGVPIKEGPLPSSLCLKASFNGKIWFAQTLVSFFFDVIHCVKSVHTEIFSGPYSVPMQKNTDQKNSEYGFLSRNYDENDNDRNNKNHHYMKYCQIPNFLEWTFCGNIQFSQSLGHIAQNSV